MTMEAPEGQVKLTPGLYLVATPIGNLRDVTLRALDVLRAVSVVACEDTRITRRLMDRYAIPTPLSRYDDHSSDADRQRLIDRMKAGEAVALASDAGTPLVSDPGFKLVRAAIAEGVDVVPIPGPSSVLAALCVAGLPTDRFSFGGFLPEKQVARQNALNEALRLPGTIVVFESARRLPASLADLAAIAPGRPVVVARRAGPSAERAAAAGRLGDHHGLRARRCHQRGADRDARGFEGRSGAVRHAGLDDVRDHRQGIDSHLQVQRAPAWWPMDADHAGQGWHQGRCAIGQAGGGEAGTAQAGARPADAARARNRIALLGRASGRRAAE